MVLQKYMSQSDGIKAAEDKIQEEGPTLDAVRSWHQGSSHVPEAPNAARTTASPDWAGEVVWNWRKKIPFSALEVGTFDSNHTFLSWKRTFS